MIHKLLLSSALACLSVGAFAVCNVAPPTVTDVYWCLAALDENVPSENRQIIITASDYDGEVLWYTDEYLTEKYAEGPDLLIKQYGESFQMQLYAISKQVNGTEVCYSEPARMTIRAQLRPSKPEANYGYHEGKLIVFEGDLIPLHNKTLQAKLSLYKYDDYISSMSLGNRPTAIIESEQIDVNMLQVESGHLSKFIVKQTDISTGCYSDTIVFEPIVFPRFKIDQVLSPNDVAYETVYIEQLKLKSLQIEAELLKQLLATTMPTIINDSLVVWYYKPASVLKADASWSVAGYGPNFVPQQYGTYMAEIHNTKGELVAVTKQYTVALGTPVAELAPAELAITYSAREITLSQPAHIAVYSSAGACVAQGTGTSLTLTQLPAGVYIAKASTASASAELKITIQ